MGSEGLFRATFHPYLCSLVLISSNTEDRKSSLLQPVWVSIVGNNTGMGEGRGGVSERKLQDNWYTGMLTTVIKNLGLEPVCIMHDELW